LTRRGTLDAAASWRYAPRMVQALRIVLQAVLFFLLLSLFLGVISGQTGALEKLALIAVGAALIWLAWHVRRLGDPTRHA